MMGCARFGKGKQVEIFSDLGEFAVLNITTQNDRQIKLRAHCWLASGCGPLLGDHSLMDVFPDESRPFAIGKNIER